VRVGARPQLIRKLRQPRRGACLGAGPPAGGCRRGTDRPGSGLIAADSANGLSLSLPLEQWFSIPPSMTVALLRPPVGVSVHLACRTHLTDDGVGLAHANLFDTNGFIGEVAQPLLVQKREPQ